MVTRKQVDAWIAQAEADLAASRAQAAGIAECHRRYWLQQSYEKAIKAYALMRWRTAPGGAADEEKRFEQLFIFQHSPLKTTAQANDQLPKSIRARLKDITTFVNGLQGSALLFKIDETTPRKDPNEKSYRYPFLLEGQYLAPAAYEDWDGYQGNSMGVWSAVEGLLKAVKDERKSISRGPA